MSAVARLKANSGYARNTERAQDIRAIVEALESTTAALETSLRVEAGWRARAIALEESAAWEYGTRWVIEGDPREAWPPAREARVVEYVEDSEEYALDLIEKDRIAMKLDAPRGKLIRRPKVGAWEEVA